MSWHVADFMGYRNLLDVDVTAVAGDAVTVAGRGLTLRGTAMGPVAVGDRVRVAVRPEDLTVAPGAPTQGGTTTTARVSVVEYHGREFAVEALTSSGLALHARSHHAPRVGSIVELTADPRRVLVYRTGPGHPAPSANQEPS
ncbi:TOBE domain-containing protein [Cellulomonas sp. ATA003]|uniref:TOBE domain-containing protein n=1 Tax=Cellulomonas sp. ATA003 TaxID=3073064 RepID=UPI0028730C03|nr:TOBE domain-containing protein [Cellulomonas sp. ATA003]WNB85901.1 TOBE domain-containing protein [Cellulomonas sp. ATA003]